MTQVRAGTQAMFVAAMALLAAPATALAQEAKPAGGAAIGEIVIATGAATIVTAALLYLGLGHRRGTNRWLARAAAKTERASGLPGWASLPSALATVSLLVALLGMYWDISLHIDVGRDEGPLANPAHHLILYGLFGIFSAGFLAMVLPKERPGPTAVRITRDWYAPLGGTLITACGAFSLIGFPLDDFWHRLFGQDVTLWGPTHLMLIGGAAMTLLGQAVLLVEGLRARAASGGGTQAPAAIVRLRTIALSGGVLIGLSTFQAEFDFGVPQFRFIFAPMLVMLAASVGLVLIRVWLGRGAALGAVAFFLVMRGGLALLVGPVFGETTPKFPLYLGAAIVVEAVALWISPRRAVPFALACGAGIGTIGLASEWAWSQVWMPLPWPSELFPEGAVFGLAMAVAGSLVGAWIGTKLSSGARAPAHGLRTAALVGATGIAVLVAIGLYKPADTGVRGAVELTDVQRGAERTVSATVSIDPPAAAENAEWLTATAWQGGGLVVNRLEQVAPGRYRATQPIPVHGEWKALVRLHNGASLTGIPLYLPEDPAIPAKAVPAEARFERPFAADHTILQREQKAAATALTYGGYGVVLAIALGLLGMVAWGLHRVGATRPGGDLRQPGGDGRRRTSRSRPGVQVATR